MSEARRAAALLWAMLAVLFVSAPALSQPEAPPSGSAPPPAAPPPAPPPATGPPATARSAADFEDARARMEKGQRLFADGKFAEAVEEFVAAFDRHKFTAFLFNAAVAAEKGGKREQAIDLYGRFLSLEPNAPDKPEIDKTLERLKKEQAAQALEPSGETQRAAIRSLVLIESEPSGAPITVYERFDPKAAPLDPRKPDQIGYRKVRAGLKTPANLSLALGTYFVLVEGFQDYNPTGSLFTFEAGRAYVYRAGLSQGDFVGRVEISMPIGSGQVWVDDPPPHKNAPRAVGPSSIELSPGKHTFYVEAPGFEPWEKTIVVPQGKTTPLEAKLERVGYGYLLIRGNAPEVEVEVNGMDAGLYKKKTGPLRVRVPAGDHFVEIDADDRKAYESIVTVPPGQEVTIDSKLEEAPGRGGAIVVTIFSVGALAGGIVLNRYAAGLADGDDLKDPLNYVSIGTIIGGGVLAGLSVFLFIWDPTDDSTAKVSAPREFTDELPKDKELPKKREATAPPPLDIGLLWSSGPDGGPSAPAGLTFMGRF
jgi:hypothetical protein